MATIYARPANPLGPNGRGGFLCQAELWTTTEPEALPTTGEGIVGMSDLDTFAAGSRLTCTGDGTGESRKIFWTGEDEGEFTLAKEW